MYIHCSLRTVLPEVCGKDDTFVEAWGRREIITVYAWGHLYSFSLGRKVSIIVKTLLPRQVIFTIFLDLVSFINDNADFYIIRDQAVTAGREY